MIGRKITGKGVGGLPVIGRGIIASSGAAPAPSCSITLEAPGALSVAGALAMDVSGQTASITLPGDHDSSNDQYSATSQDGLEIGTFTGRRAVEHVNSSSWSTSGAGDWVARGFYDDPPATDAVWRWDQDATEWKVIVGGAQQTTVAGNPDDATAVVLVDNGDVEFWHGASAGNMTLITTVAAYSSGNIVKLGTLTQGGQAGDTKSTGFKTSDYSQDFNGADGWCGDAI